MPDLLQDLETYFISKSLITVAHRDTINDSPDIVVALYEYPGLMPAPQITGALRNVQVVARDKSATAAKEKARALHQALAEADDGILNLTTGRWCTVKLRDLPFKLKVDAKERQYYCFNVSFITYID